MTSEQNCRYEEVSRDRTVEVAKCHVTFNSIGVVMRRLTVDV